MQKKWIAGTYYEFYSEVEVIELMDKLREALLDPNWKNIVVTSEKSYESTYIVVNGMKLETDEQYEARTKWEKIDEDRERAQLDYLKAKYEGNKK